MRKSVPFLIMLFVVTLSVAPLAAVAATSAKPTPTGVQADGRIAGCVKTGTAGAPADLFVRTTDGTCGKGFKTVYFNQRGPKGATGPAGAKGDQGEQGEAAPEAVYATGLVYISRGGADATVWAKASTALGSPDGDTASNTFRATCSTAKAPCVISVKARATSSATVYPRLLIQKSNIDTGAPAGLCEYGDGTDNDGGTAAIGTDLAAVPLGIGGSLDCGAGQVRPDSGVVESITVPAGYYDIAATFTFSRVLSAN